MVTISNLYQLLQWLAIDFVDQIIQERNCLFNPQNQNLQAIKLEPNFKAELLNNHQDCKLNEQSDDFTIVTKVISKIYHQIYQEFGPQVFQTVYGSSELAFEIDKYQDQIDQANEKLSQLEIEDQAKTSVYNHINTELMDYFKIQQGKKRKLIQLQNQLIDLKEDLRTRWLNWSWS